MTLSLSFFLDGFRPMIFYTFNLELVYSFTLLISSIVLWSSSLFFNILLIILCVLILVFTTAFFYNIFFLSMLLGIMYVGRILLFFSYSVILSRLKSVSPSNVPFFLLFLFYFFFLDFYFFFYDSRFNILDLHNFSFFFFFIRIIVILLVLFSCVNICLEKHF